MPVKSPGLFGYSPPCQSYTHRNRCALLHLLPGVACSECVARAKRAAKGWEGLQVLQVLEGWRAYLGYGLPCVLMVCLEVSSVLGL